MTGNGIWEKFSENTTVEKALEETTAEDLWVSLEKMTAEERWALLEEMTTEELRGFLPVAMMYSSGDADRLIRQMIRAREGKRGRGRPKKFDGHFLSVGTRKSMAPGAGPNTWRGHQNHFYQQRALTVLRRDKENLETYLWLADMRDELFDKVFKGTILMELGRVDDDWTLICYARELCEKKLGTKEAVALIRRTRLDQAPRASVSALVHVIARAIAEYGQTREGMTDDIALEAVGAYYRLLLKAGN